MFVCMYTYVTKDRQISMQKESSVSSDHHHHDLGLDLGIQFRRRRCSLAGWSALSACSRCWLSSCLIDATGWVDSDDVIDNHVMSDINNSKGAFRLGYIDLCCNLLLRNFFGCWDLCFVCDIALPCCRNGSPQRGSSRSMIRSQTSKAPEVKKWQCQVFALK